MMITHKSVARFLKIFSFVCFDNIKRGSLFNTPVSQSSIGPSKMVLLIFMFLFLDSLIIVLKHTYAINQDLPHPYLRCIVKSTGLDKIKNVFFGSHLV